MKNFFLLSILFTFFISFFSQCKKSVLTIRDDTSATLYNCTARQAEPYICFDSLLTDSRCPKGAECVWQGTALIKVSFHERGNTHHFIMSLKDFPGLGHPADTTIHGYNIVFTRLEPYPDLQNHQQKIPVAYFSIK